MNVFFSANLKLKEKKIGGGGMGMGGGGRLVGGGVGSNK